MNVGTLSNQAQQDPVAIPRLDGPANHLEEMTKGLHEYITRLNRVADRLNGATPEGVEKEGGRVGAACVAGRYEQIQDVYASLIRKLGNVVERLETL